jgi:hypothetical protein
MIEVLFSVFVLISLIYVLSPLIGEMYWPFLSKGNFAELHHARKEGIWAISDVDSEYEMGKLTKDDHAFLREYLKGEVAPVLKEEKDILNRALKPEKEISDDLKEDIIREVVKIWGKKHSA